MKKAAGNLPAANNPNHSKITGSPILSRDPGSGYCTGVLTTCTLAILGNKKGHRATALVTLRVHPVVCSEVKLRSTGNEARTQW